MNNKDGGKFPSIPCLFNLILMENPGIKNIMQMQHTSIKEKAVYFKEILASPFF